jgi:hypothetical protein
MLALIRRNQLFFAFFLVLGFLLRGYMLKWHFLFQGDSLIYGDIAKNWLVHGVYGVTDGTSVLPVDIRTPGYPAFLAACFRLFGIEHYGAVVRVQLVVDLLTCFAVAAGARRLLSDSAAKVSFVLAALCPFTANYAATPLPETLEIFFVAIALLFALAATHKIRRAPPWDVRQTFAFFDWIAAGLAIAACIYLRPDGGVLLIAIGLYLLWLAIQLRQSEYMAATVVLGLASLLPLLPWTVRNWRTLHQFEPLAPFYAELPGEYVPTGFNRWCKTWVVDFISVMDVEWNVSTGSDGEAVNVKDVPERAYYSAAQRQKTDDLFRQYNESLQLTPQLDAEFAALAAERIRAHPIAYYLGLPLARLADMWLRPRTEMFNLQLDWWNSHEVWQESAMSLGLAALNLFYLLAALLSLRRRLPGSAMLWLFILCRSVLLATLPNPEPRYTLECFPAVLMLAGTSLGRIVRFPDSVIL